MARSWEGLGICLMCILNTFWLDRALLVNASDRRIDSLSLETLCSRNVDNASVIFSTAKSFDGKYVTYQQARCANGVHPLVSQYGTSFVQVFFPSRPDPDMDECLFHGPFNNRTTVVYNVSVSFLWSDGGISEVATECILPISEGIPSPEPQYAKQEGSSASSAPDQGLKSSGTGSTRTATDLQSTIPAEEGSTLDPLLRTNTNYQNTTNEPRINLELSTTGPVKEGSEVEPSNNQTETSVPQVKHGPNSTNTAGKEPQEDPLLETNPSNLDTTREPEIKPLGSSDPLLKTYSSHNSTDTPETNSTEVDPLLKTKSSHDLNDTSTNTLSEITLTNALNEITSTSNPIISKRMDTIDTLLTTENQPESSSEKTLPTTLPMNETGSTKDVTISRSTETTDAPQQNRNENPENQPVTSSYSMTSTSSSGKTKTSMVSAEDPGDNFTTLAPTSAARLETGVSTTRTESVSTSEGLGTTKGPVSDGGEDESQHSVNPKYNTTESLPNKEEHDTQSTTNSRDESSITTESPFVVTENVFQSTTDYKDNVTKPTLNHDEDDVSSITEGPLDEGENVKPSIPGNDSANKTARPMDVEHVTKLTLDANDDVAPNTTEIKISKTTIVPTDRDDDFTTDGPLNQVGMNVSQTMIDVADSIKTESPVDEDENITEPQMTPDEVLSSTTGEMDFSKITKVPNSGENSINSKETMDISTVTLNLKTESTTDNHVDLEENITETTIDPGDDVSSKTTESPLDEDEMNVTDISLNTKDAKKTEGPVNDKNTVSETTLKSIDSKVSSTSESPLNENAMTTSDPTNDSASSISTDDLEGMNAADPKNLGNSVPSNKSENSTNVNETKNPLNSTKSDETGSLSIPKISKLVEGVIGEVDNPELREQNLPSGVPRKESKSGDVGISPEDQDLKMDKAQIIKTNSSLMSGVDRSIKVKHNDICDQLNIGYIVKLSANCLLNGNKLAQVEIITDVSLSAVAICYKDFEYKLQSSDGVTLFLNISYDTHDAHKECVFKPDPSSSTYTALVGISWGVGNSGPCFKSYRVTCTLGPKSFKESESSRLSHSLYASKEIKSNNGPRSDADIKVQVVDILNQTLTPPVMQGKKIRLVAESSGAEQEVGLTPSSCWVYGVPGRERYPLLTAGCGDGWILPLGEGFVTEGLKTFSPYFSAFRLQNSVKLFFECDFTFCQENCNGSSCAHDRKKRSLTSLPDAIVEPSLYIVEVDYGLDLILPLLFSLGMTVIFMQCLFIYFFVNGTLKLKRKL